MDSHGRSEGARLRMEAQQILPQLRNQRTSHWICEWLGALTRVLDALHSTQPLTVEEKIRQARHELPFEILERFDRLVSPINEIDDRTTEAKLTEEIAWSCNSKCIDLLLKADQMEEPDEDIETRALQLLLDLRREFEKILGVASSSASSSDE